MHQGDYQCSSWSGHEIANSKMKREDKSREVKWYLNASGSDISVESRFLLLQKRYVTSLYQTICLLNQRIGQRVKPSSFYWPLLFNNVVPVWRICRAKSVLKCLANIVVWKFSNSTLRWSVPLCHMILNEFKLFKSALQCILHSKSNKKHKVKKEKGWYNTNYVAKLCGVHAFHNTKWKNSLGLASQGKRGETGSQEHFTSTMFCINSNQGG